MRQSHDLSSPIDWRLRPLVLFSLGDILACQRYAQCLTSAHSLSKQGLAADIWRSTKGDLENRRLRDCTMGALL
jgi:hypothetical protein